MFLGETATVDVSAAFTDPDGDALTFEAASSDTAVVVVATSGSDVTLEGSGRGVTTVTVTARDAEGGEASQSFGVEVANRTPLAVGEIPPRTMFLGETATVDVSAAFTDPDGDALTFEAVSSDTDVVVVTASGSEVTLEAAGRGATTATVTARDAEGGEASQSFGVEVANRTPLAVGEIPPQTMFLGETATVDVSAAFTDPDGDALTFEAASSDAAVVVVATSGSDVVVSGVKEGTATVTVRAADSAGLSVARDFDVTVGTRGSTNQPPVVTRAIPAQTVRENESVSMDLDGYFSDPEGGTLVYGASSSDDDVAAAAVSGSDVVVSGVKEGTATVTVRAADSAGLSVARDFDVTVSTRGSTNQPPVVTRAIPAQTVRENESVSVDLDGYFSDPEGGTLVYGASSSDDDVAAAAVSGSDLVVSGVKEGTATVTVRAADSAGLSVARDFDVTVSTRGSTNQPPVVTRAIPAQTVRENESVSVDLDGYFSDPEGGALVYGASSSDDDVAAAAVSGSDLVVSGVKEGTATVTVRAADSAGLSVARDFDVTVSTRGSTNQPPVVTRAIPAQTVGKNESVSMDLDGYFSDPEGGALVYGASSSDDDVAAAAVSGRDLVVSGVEEGTATVTVRAADSAGLSVARDFDVTVRRGWTNWAPRQTRLLPAQTVRENESVSVDLDDHFSDPEGGPLVYGASSSNDDVAAAAVSGSDLVVSGVQEGTATVTVRAEDREGQSVARDFDVTVRNRGSTNQSPQVDLNIPDRTYAVGLYFQTFLRRYISDPDGDHLSFGVTSSNPASVTVELLIPWVMPDLLRADAVSEGDATVTVTATDPGGLTATLTFDMAARDLPNHPPEIKATIPDVTLTAGRNFGVRNIYDYFTDPDEEYGDYIVFETTSADETIVYTAVDWVDNQLTWLFSGRLPGMTTATVTGTDRRGLSVSQTINVTVEAAGGR